MDVLAPPLIWVEGGCYRFYETNAWNSEDMDIPVGSFQESKSREFCDFDDETSSVDTDIIPIERDTYEQETFENSDVILVERDTCKQETSLNVDVMPIERDAYKEETSSNIDVIPTEREANKQETSANIDIVDIGKGKYQHTFQIHRPVVPRIIGCKGSTIFNLEFDTCTSIKILKHRSSANVVITGSKREAVVLARNRIDLLIGKSNNRHRYTHFLSIPLTDENIVANYNEFKTVVLNETAKNSKGVREELFKKPEKLHLCIGAMALQNDEQIQAAIRALQECNERILKPIIRRNGPVIMKVQGLWIPVRDPDIMVNTLTGNVSSEDNVLQKLAESTVNFFVHKGLMVKPREQLRMRMALMNVLFAVDKRNPDAQPQQFHPKNILMNHHDYFFGDTVLKSIHLSQRGSYGSDGYYTTVSKINLID